MKINRKEILIFSGILGLSLATSFYLLQTKPKVAKEAVTEKRLSVEVTPIEYQASSEMTMTLLGNVVAAETLLIKAEVSGELARIHPHFNLGQTLKKGELMVSLKGEAIEHEARMAQEDRRQAQAQLAMVKGEVNAARFDYQSAQALMPEAKSLTREALSRVLKEPHLTVAQANFEKTRSQEKEAQRRVKALSIQAPFEALVLERHSTLGQWVESQETIGSVIGTDYFWVDVWVPIQTLEKHAAAIKNAQARVFNRQGQARKGTLVNQVWVMDPTTKMAQLRFKVTDPLGLKDGLWPLMVGERTSVEVDFGTLKGVWAIPREALRDDNRVWVVENKEGQSTIKSRRLKVLWKDDHTIYVNDDLTGVTQVVTSFIDNPFEGMAIRPYEVRALYSTRGQ